MKLRTLIHKALSALLFLVGVMLTVWVLYNLFIVTHPTTEGRNPTIPLLIAGYLMFRGWQSMRQGEPPKMTSEASIPARVMAIDYDNEQVRVYARNMDPELNQTFRWDEITRVCFLDGGLQSSDILSIELRGREKPVTIFTEAQEGVGIFGQLVDRGYFPEEAWRKAVGSTNSEMTCWPPKPSN